jgi:hypothetical protein
MPGDKMKTSGFAGILLLFAIAVMGIVLLTTNTQTKQEQSAKEIFPEIHLEITNFETVLTQEAQDCDTTNPLININECIDANAATLFALDSNTKSVLRNNCRKNPAVKTETNTAHFYLDCNTKIKIGTETWIDLNISKIIEIKKQ